MSSKPNRPHPPVPVAGRSQLKQARRERLQDMARIVQARRCTTLMYLADRYEMSERNVARDIAELKRMGMKIVGSPKDGYGIERLS